MGILHPQPTAKPLPSVRHVMLTIKHLDGFSCRLQTCGPSPACLISHLRAAAKSSLLSGPPPPVSLVVLLTQEPALGREGANGLGFRIQLLGQ
jgi:hypothetical protein